jgi:uncharacterized membrane protein
MSYPPSSYPPSGNYPGGGGFPPPAGEGKTKVLSLDYNIAGMLSYLYPLCCINMILAIILLVTEPKESRFVRFHALQSLLLGAVFITILIMLRIVSSLMIGTAVATGEAGAVTGIGLAFIFLLIYGIVVLVWLVASVVGMVKAYQNGMVKFPIIGGIAEKNS